MNNLKKTTIALVGLWALAATTFVFADNDTASGSMNDHSSKSQGYGKMHKSGTESFLKHFLRTDLTALEKTAMENLGKAYTDALKKFYETNKSNMKDPAVQVQLKALQDNYTTNLMVYVATDKQEAFKKFMPSKSSHDDDKDRSDAKPEKIKNGDLLPKNMSTTIDTKLATLPTIDAKLTWIANVKAKIDALMSKVSGQKSKDVLTALKDLLNQKIDVINNVSIDFDSLLN